MKYGIIGVAGYVAKKHIKAVEETGGQIIHACDLHDNVGFLDSHSMKVKFTKDYEDVIVDPEVETVVICTPNNLHYQMAIEAMYAGKDVILEKPACLSLVQLDEMIEVERKLNRKVSLLMQMRYNDKLMGTVIPEHSTISLVYFTPRGPWYYTTWKNRPELSGGLEFNIGIHMWDVLGHFLGAPLYVDKNHQSALESSGTLYYPAKDVHVHYRLSIKPEHKATRSLKVYQNAFETKSINMSEGFDINHTLAYHNILAGNRVKLEDTRSAIYTAALMRKGCK